ncbi:MAG: hypothetical protein WC758_02620 [Candidatus Woesearchaeota archaeon]|jgi:hypothetical protein
MVGETECCDEDITPESDEKINSLMLDLESELQCNGLIVLIFNPHISQGALIEGDMQKNIAAFLDGLKNNNATVLLYGLGGCFTEGLMLAHTIRKKFSHFNTLVPSICASALCLTVLKSDNLKILKNGCLTQIDPVIVHDGKPIRAIKYLHDLDEETKQNCQSMFRYAEQQIIDLISNKPSLFNHSKREFDFADKDDIITLFMNKDEHSDGIKKMEFQYRLDNFNVEYDDNPELLNKSMNLITEVINVLNEQQERYFLGCTYETKLNDKTKKTERQGKLLYCP